MVKVTPFSLTLQLVQVTSEKNINQQLIDLVKFGMLANGRETRLSDSSGPMEQLLVGRMTGTLLLTRTGSGTTEA